MAQTTGTTDIATSTGGIASGTTTVVDPVVAKLAGIAAREVPGVHALGAGAARLVGNIREAIGNKDLSQGVTVEVGETEVAADVTIVVEYPEPLQVVAEAVRASVARTISELVGMKVAEVNVIVTDVFIPGEDDTAEVEEARVS